MTPFLQVDRRFYSELFLWQVNMPKLVMPDLIRAIMEPRNREGD